MANFLYKTKGNSSPERKPRVYFACHPEDFSKHFEKICEDIFATHDCAIFYTETMTEEIEEKYKESDLGQMNLFVIPVTFKLLSKPNRAMDSDFRYAQEKHIPVLPIMMETGIDEFYSAKDKFGEAQYLSPYIQDKTAISYEEKLKKYLESVLISNETAERIRKAFDAYIFLSYRKKDRHYATQLMKLIHSHSEFRDIAIWYDEFLTPGESFRANIEKMMKDSKLFTLLVTPNLLEYVNDEPNYVMAHEYPDAKKAGMDILPTEMEDTDKTELCSNYPEIPECINPNEDEQFKKRLAETLSKIAISENNNDPEHNFLIGLAYLDGIDVEKNTERGIELITMAAEANLLEAMKKLYDMYDEGKGIQVDYRKAAKWAERIWKYFKEKYGEEVPSTLTALNNLAIAYGKLGDHQKALELQERGYATECKILGAEHPDTLGALNNLASTYGELGDHRKALELQEKCYTLCCKIIGAEHPDTLNTLHNLAYTYDALGDYRKALEVQEKVYALRCKILGEEHPDTLTTLNNLAVTYDELGDHRKALELQEKVYALRCKISGEEHPSTLTTLSNLASTYGNLGDYRKALELKEKVYATECKILGEEHPYTLTTLSNLAFTYGDLGDHRKALELEEKVYALRCKILGEEHPDTLTTLNNLAVTYDELGNHRKALELNEKVYALRCKILGEEHSNTLNTLSGLAYAHYQLGNYRKSLELYEKCYTLRCQISGKEHPNTLKTLRNLAATHNDLGNHQKAFELQEKLYTLRCKVLGENDPLTLKSKERLEEYRKKLDSQATSAPENKKPSFFQRIFKKKK